MFGHNVIPVTRTNEGSTGGKGESLTLKNVGKVFFDADTAVAGSVKYGVMAVGALAMNILMSNTYTGKPRVTNPLKVHRTARLFINSNP